MWAGPGWLSLGITLIVPTFFHVVILFSVPQNSQTVHMKTQSSSTSNPERQAGVAQPLSTQFQKATVSLHYTLLPIATKAYT